MTTKGSLLFASSNEKDLDSLYNLLENTTDDSTRLYLMYRIGYEKNESRFSYWDSLIVEIEKKDYKGLLAIVYNNYGYRCYKSGIYDQAITLYFKSLKINEKLGIKAGVAAAYNNLSQVYKMQGEKELAKEYLKKSIAYCKKKSITDKLAMTTYNLYVLLIEMKDTVEALKTMKECVGYYESMNTPYNDASADYVRGDIHAFGGSLDSALFYFEKALKYYYSIEDYYDALITLDRVSTINLDKKNYDATLKYSQEELDLAKKLHYDHFIYGAAKRLYEVYEHKENDSKAFEYYKLYIKARDSVNSVNVQRAAFKEKSKYEYEKQKALDDKENEKRIAIEKEKQEKQFMVLVTTIIGASLVMVLLLIIYRRLQITKKQKVIIEEQKEEVESQRDQIESQKDVIEEKHKEIQESISYARRIQTAILPPKRMLADILPKSFVLYRPKDVVAGDFYWVEHSGNSVFFAVADCTGHGVPGAMVSVVCHGALNRCIREYKLSRPSDILNKTRELVIDTFEKSEEQVKDGMDVSLCSWNKETNKIEYAGANNPLYLIFPVEADREPEVEIIKADRQPIGYTQDPQPFTNHEVDIEPGMLIYLFSDGYADQFGGNKGKKLGYKRFREKLLELHTEHFKEQEEKLIYFFEEWKGEEEQIDDVCLMGIQFN